MTTPDIERVKAVCERLADMIAPKAYLPSILGAITMRCTRPVGEIDAFLEGRFPEEERPSRKEIFDLKTAAGMWLR